jgi:hypothetical protein
MIFHLEWEKFYLCLDILSILAEEGHPRGQPNLTSPYTLGHSELLVLPFYVPTPHQQVFCLFLAEGAELCQFFSEAWEWQLPQLKNGEETPVALMLQQSV